MLAEAEKYKAEDEEAAARVQAKNGLESYAYSLKATLGENGDKFGEDKAVLEAKVEEVIKQLDTMESASKEEFEAVQKEVRHVPGLV